KGLHLAAASGDVAEIRRLAADKKQLNARDSCGRTPLMVAAYKSRIDAATALIAAGADLDALENDRYDVVTISSVANDVKMLKLVLESSAKAGQMTSPYDGTALIAAAHLGHVDVVKALIAAGAPLDHVNNLNWTALIESIVLGDGGSNHVACLTALIEAGADVNIADGNGVSPLQLAERHGFDEMVRLLKAAGAK
ncbi:MAG: ankyrin repeat domain-containing protein, partial [Rhodospirillaceae bacterium]|nr:ankyrin repeat domain-containing protein [Rhodospirillaceae bacterium]